VEVFLPFWRILSGPGRQPNEPIFWIKIVLESRLSSESLQHLFGFLAYLEPKLWLKNRVFDKIQRVTQKVSLAISNELLARITRQQIELESSSNPLKSRDVL